MLSRYSEVFRSLLLVSDLSLVAASWMAAYYVRFHGSIEIPRGVPGFRPYAELLVVILPLWPFRRARGAPMPHWLEAGAGMALVAAIGLGQALRPERPGARAERDAALWLAANAEHPGAVAAPKMRLAYYAGRAHVSLYAAPRGEAMIRALQQQGAQYVILEEKKLSDFPELGAAVGTSLRVVHSEEDRGRRAFVYKLMSAVSDAAAPGLEAPKANPREDD